jgi:hypothetical protein
MHLEVSKIPFIGEDGYYPQWARRSGRWVFQRTLVETGGILFGGIARLHAAEVAVSDQMIVGFLRLGYQFLEHCHPRYIASDSRHWAL